jgi:LPXTG-site transpeptidase (sortase) family protein
VRTADRLTEARRAADVSRWNDEQRAVSNWTARLPASPTVIVPGEAGYLLEIPKLGLKAIVRQLEPEVFSGRNTPRLKRFGLGQVPFTTTLRNVSPGADGTAVITGHRTTSGAPFRNLHRLGPGDAIILRQGSEEQRWTVAYAMIVPPERTDSIRSRPGARRLVIMACSPPFSAHERLIVYATLSNKGAGDDAISTALRRTISGNGAGDQDR